MSIDPFAPATEAAAPEPEQAEAPKPAARKAAAKAPAAADPFSGTSSTEAAPTGDDPFGDPAPSGNRPAFRQLVGRYLVVRPTKLELKVAAIGDGEPRDRMTADIMVCNGDPITVKLDKDGDVVAELDPPVKAGDVLEDFYISGAKVISELKPALKRGTPVVGRLVQLPAQKVGYSKAYSLEEVPTGPARQAAAKMWKTWTDAQAEAGVSDPFAG